MSEFIYKNPICPEVVKAIRDPFILLDGDTYYLTGTTPPFWDGNSNGVFLWKSDDLLRWEEVGFILHRSCANEKDWFCDYWWAPEIHKKNGKYYLTVNCRNDRLGLDQNPLFAVSDRIDGDYKLLNPDEPFFTKEKQAKGVCVGNHGNDANLFTDDDGKTYLSTCCFEGIHIVEIDLENMKLKGEETLMIKPESNGSWDTKNEGSFVMKRNGRYYCFYSSFTRSYEVGVAYADNIRGPWIKDENNPIITPLHTEGICHSGHNCIFTDKKGRVMTAYHITFDTDKDTHLLAIDPIYFDEDGKVSTPAPTITTQKI